MLNCKCEDCEIISSKFVSLNTTTCELSNPMQHPFAAFNLMSLQHHFWSEQLSSTVCLNALFNS